MEQKIKFLKSIMDCEQFILTGSQCFKLLGLTEVAHDIDIILVNPTTETKKMLENIQLLHKAKTKFPYKEKGVIFMYEGVKVDVFFQTSKIDTKIKAWGEIDLNPIKNIISAKKSYHRVKDWVQLRKMSKVFFSQEEFEIFLNNQINK